MKPWKIALVTVIVVFAVTVAYGAFLIRDGFSARRKPSGLEISVARTMRDMAIPGNARDENNPFTSTAEILTEARQHFADHCATCHANDGSGKTEIGQNLYPKAPDMRSPYTQSLTDGEIYFIIHNGVRLTGMPAWGPDTGKDDDSWKLVVFIRHLPQMKPQEMKEMEPFNPKSAVERSEEQDEQNFLNRRKTPKMNSHR
jgi:mono/diheme cytochrome c family protein